ncbi:MAG: EF-P beta-lysylation protein EpmB [Blastopirellula sp.]|nr:MAG: EF-P beta-lysylation protein EpmB [Blastopirellula sp.]
MRIVTSQSDSVRSTSAAARESTAIKLPVWQQAMKNAIRNMADLARFLELSDDSIVQAEAAVQQFPLFVPQAFAAKMEKGNPNDPLLLQVLPQQQETVDTKGFTSDPVGDSSATLSPGLLQKYHGRALMVVTGACAVHCRYCFRRHFPYSESPKGLEAWLPAIEQLAADDSIQEIILSGGDPLTLVDEKLAILVAELEKIPHLQRLRIHTRLPIMIPERVNSDLLSWLTGSRLTPVMVVHANHPHELDEAVLNSLGQIVDAGVPVLNQAVLLRGVNDDADVLTELCERLVNARVMPYYLHQLDKVTGAAHFEVPKKTGKRLIQQLHGRLPGYAVPRYVEEIQGDVGKVSIQ